jgi:hypothetical protein
MVKHRRCDWSTEGATGAPKVRPKDDVVDIIDRRPEGSSYRRVFLPKMLRLFGL